MEHLSKGRLRLRNLAGIAIMAGVFAEGTYFGLANDNPWSFIGFLLGEAALMSVVALIAGPAGDELHRRARLKKQAKQLQISRRS